MGDEDDGDEGNAVTEGGEDEVAGTDGPQVAQKSIDVAPKKTKKGVTTTKTKVTHKIITKTITKVRGKPVPVSAAAEGPGAHIPGAVAPTAPSQVDMYQPAAAYGRDQNAVVNPAAYQQMYNPAMMQYSQPSFLPPSVPHHEDHAAHFGSSLILVFVVIVAFVLMCGGAFLIRQKNNKTVAEMIGSLMKDSKKKGGRRDSC